MVKAYKFPKTRRLLNSKDFEFLRMGSARLTTPWLVVYTKPSRLGTDTSRVGFSVSKKVGNAVLRNRIKRLIRESFRTWVAGSKLGLDIMIVVSPKLTKISPGTPAFEKELCSSLNYLKNKISAKNAH